MVAMASIRLCMGSVKTLAPLCGDTYSKPIELLGNPKV
jgi:hypothetical protein